MPMVRGREYRAFAPMRAEGDEGTFKVHGYASTFDPYVLFSVDGVDYSERIDPHAFDAADMSDVIMQYDHEGRVFARQSNGTLKLSVDDHGLAVEADLGSTSGSRALYEDIQAGLITRMSFCFTIGAEHMEGDCRVVDQVAKVYDVSAVSIPANPGTDISARSLLDGAIERARAERLAKRRRKMLMDLEVLSLWTKLNCRRG